jgi:hypothetical protein
MSYSNRQLSKRQQLVINLISIVFGLAGLTSALLGIVCYEEAENLLKNPAAINPDMPISVVLGGLMFQVFAIAFGLYAILAFSSGVGLFRRKPWGLKCSYCAISLYSLGNGFLIYIDVAEKRFPFASLFWLLGISISGWVMFYLSSDLIRKHFRN